MKTSVKKIVSEALQLPPPLRALIAEQLIESLDAPSGPSGLSPAWRAEILRRCAEIDEGRAELLDADEVMAEAFASLE
jgi:putative addiction module component (TIGR02574 family)